MAKPPEADMPAELELLLVRYRFDCTGREHQRSGHVYHEIGHNDVGIPLVTSSDGCLYPMEDRPVFVNSSPQAFGKCVGAYQCAAILKDNAIPNDERIPAFRKIIKSSAPVCLDDSGSFWSLINEEMEYDII